jgi:DNA-binding transcriptional regulator PaaX
MSKDTINIDDWVASRRSASRRSGSVLISLISDFVVPHGGAIALGSLVDAGACVGVSEHTIRSSV